MAIVIHTTKSYSPKSTDPKAAYEEIRGRITTTCIVDNRKGRSDKTVIARMVAGDGSSCSNPFDYVPAGEVFYDDLVSLGQAFTEVDFAWCVVGESTWKKQGVCAIPGNYFPFFGIMWDEDDRAHLILPLA
jgi:hypothetical protein